MYNLKTSVWHKESLLETIQQAVVNLQNSQHVNGAWDDCFDTGVMADAQTLISLYLLGHSDREWTELLLKRIESHQRGNGVWGVYPGDEGDLSTTVECYYALQLHNRWDCRPQRREQTREFIVCHGGLKKCRNLTKMFLAIGGEIPWSWLPSPWIYSWLFTKFSPIQIWHVVMFTRLHIPPMLVLSALGYVSEFASSPVLGELLPPGVKVRTPQHRVMQWLPGEHGRLARCVEMMLSEREDDGTAAGYHSSTFLLLLCLQALGCKPSSQEILVPLEAIKQNLYQVEGNESAHQQTCNAHVWNTALAVQALEQAGVGTDVMAVRKGENYLLSKQQSTVSSWFLKSAVQPGGWGFSSNNTKHSDTDDTVASLSALYPVRNQHREAWWKGVEWLLAMQNKDGGWSAFEKDSNHRWLEWLPANDMQRAMTDPSTADITGRVIAFLVRARVVPIHDTTVRGGIRWLVRHQDRDGSWFGRWGATYLYGTWCAIQALTAAEVSSTDSVIKKAKEWVLSIQHNDGGFGESCESDLLGRFVALEWGTPTQTAWGLDTLLHLMQAEESAEERHRLALAAHAATKWLLEHADGGRWVEHHPTGSAFPGALHIRYHIYPKVWPLMALCHYNEVMTERQ